MYKTDPLEKQVQLAYSKSRGDKNRMDLNHLIRSISDFPRDGVQFRDVTPLLNNASAFTHCIDRFAQELQGTTFDVILGIESRGFIFASALAYAMKKPLVLARKPGKLPHETVSVRYQLEYAEDCLQIHTDAIEPQRRVLIVDDLLATGNTARAAGELVENLNARIAGYAFLIELLYLQGADKLEPHPIFSQLSFTTPSCR